MMKKMINNKSDAIEKLRLKAQIAANKLREAEEAERNAVIIPELRKIVGKCFVYQNSYGVADGCRKWPLYTRVVSFNEKGMTYKAVQFQRTTLERIEIRNEVTYNFEGRSRYGIEDGWNPISVGHYKRAMNALLKLVHELMEPSA